MIKADFIKEKDLAKLKELKRFLNRNRMSLSADKIIICFYGKGGRRWFYLTTGFHRNQWKINKPMDMFI